MAYRESGFDMSRPPRSSKAISSKRVCKHETHSAFDVGVVFAGVCSRLCATALDLENYNYWSHKDVSSYSKAAVVMEGYRGYVLALFLRGRSGGNYVVMRVRYRSASRALHLIGAVEPKSIALRMQSHCVSDIAIGKHGRFGLGLPVAYKSQTK
jgi:hypothetical protein